MNRREAFCAILGGFVGAVFGEVTHNGACSLIHHAPSLHSADCGKAQLVVTTHGGNSINTQFIDISKEKVGEDIVVTCDEDGVVTAVDFFIGEHRITGGVFDRHVQRGDKLIVRNIIVLNPPNDGYSSYGEYANAMLASTPVALYRQHESKGVKTFF